MAHRETDGERAIREYHETRTERDTLRVEVEGLRARCEASEKMLEQAAAAIREERARADAYMRLSTELMAQCNSIAAIATDAATKASHVPYRPNAGSSIVAEENPEERERLERLASALAPRAGNGHTAA